MSSGPAPDDSLAEPTRLARSVIVGSGCSNSGKTEFACGLVRTLSEGTTVHALKVSTVHGSDEPCPRGDGTGCGVCSSLECGWALTEETNVPPGSAGKKPTDTARLLSAGARRVWWLRTTKECLAEAAEAIAGLVPESGALIIESNSLRRVLEPDIYIQVRLRAADIKASARELEDRVDRFVLSDGERFNVDPERVGFTGERCVFPLEATAIILAGGRSERMGTDKRLLPVAGRPMLEHVHRQVAESFNEIVVSISDDNPPRDVQLPGARMVQDRFPGTGPLGGVISAMGAATHDVTFVLAGDIPDVPLDLVHRMVRLARQHQVVVPVRDDGRHETLFAVYNREVLPGLEQLLDGGELRIRMLYTSVDTCRLPLPAGEALTNINVKSDYLDHVNSHKF